MLVGADRDQRNLSSIELSVPFCQLTQLGSAIGSPKSAVEDDDRRPAPGESIEGVRLSVVPREGELGCFRPRRRSRRARHQRGAAADEGEQQEVAPSHAPELSSL